MGHFNYVTSVRIFLWFYCVFVSLFSFAYQSHCFHLCHATYILFCPVYFLLEYTVGLATPLVTFRLCQANPAYVFDCYHAKPAYVHAYICYHQPVESFSFFIKTFFTHRISACLSALESTRRVYSS
ncbi:hypothetical protein AMECASPLE_030244 [Ameca splendens]|uniref:Secreted protein n=1 Tax=Ameca splendens TaxID=208324 RepID=A0ABV0YH22_9TELE